MFRKLTWVFVKSSSKAFFTTGKRIAARGLKGARALSTRLASSKLWKIASLGMNAVFLWDLLRPDPETPVEAVDKAMDAVGEILSPQVVAVLVSDVQDRRLMGRVLHYHALRLLSESDEQSAFKGLVLFTLGSFIETNSRVSVIRPEDCATVLSEELAIYANSLSSNGESVDAEDLREVFEGWADGVDQAGTILSFLVFFLRFINNSDDAITLPSNPTASVANEGGSGSVVPVDSGISRIRPGFNPGDL